MKVNEFIKRLKEEEKNPTLYGWGRYGNKKEGKYLLWDCSGLIKGILWGYPNKGKYKNNGVSDYNANTIIKHCKNVSTDFSKIQIGEFVWLDGHCGVYIGNKEVIESSPKWENGVQVTKLSQRKWSKHGFLPWVDYSENIETSKVDYVKIANEVIRGEHGIGHENRKKSIKKKYPTADYNKVKELVNEKMKSKPVKVDYVKIANEVIRGEHGNGHKNREKSIHKKYPTAIYSKVRSTVNDLLKG